MGDTNPIRTLGDYSKPSHKGYMNTIELPVRNDVVPLRTDIPAFGAKADAHSHGLSSQGKNALAFILIFPHDQGSNCLERLLTGSITTCEDLTTRLPWLILSPEGLQKLPNDMASTFGSKLKSFKTMSQYPSQDETIDQDRPVASFVPENARRILGHY
ncbi:hypothetical protein Tco_0656512 [Tanacetum coccineum]|uniref:Uncharacterized protein n=1 Tax=Tanacetum coccineum TaxID=301880 RepID=A0ABQ4X9Q0_9ASTR